MEEYLLPLLFLAVLFVGFGLAHGNGERSFGCAGCSGCSDPSECKKDRDEADAAPEP